MPYTDDAKNLMLDALGAVAVKASLHTADPSTNGANEVTGGSPAYAKKTVAWSAAGSGTMNLDGTAVFDVPACTVAYVGFWDTTATTFYGSADVTDEVFAAQGTYTLTDADLDLNT